MAVLDDRWIWEEGETECPPDRSNSPQRLGLANLEGIFMMVVGGVGSGTILIIFELTYERYIKKKNDKPGEEKTNKKESRRKEKRSSQHSPATVLRRNSMSLSDRSSLCEFCNEKKNDSESYICQFCSQITSDSATLNESGSSTSDLYDAINLRLNTSANIPNSLKDLSSKDSLKYKIKTRESCIENEDGLCFHHEYSAKSLKAMLNFLEENGVEEVPSCSPIDFESFPFDIVNETPVNFQEEDVDSSSVSIISGQFSCPRKWDSDRRCKNIPDDLPDVVFNKKLHENNDSEIESEWEQKGNIGDI